MRGPAIRGLAAFDDKQTPGLLLGRYASLSDSEKQDAVTTLSSRPEFALALLDAVGDGIVPSRDLSAFTVRQLATLNNKQISERIEKVWGSIRPTDKDKAALIADYKSRFNPLVLAKADASQGRAVFTRTCAACHQLFGEGRKVGPDLTGSQRTNLDYVLQNLLDPNAIVGRDFRVTIIVTASGRVVTGIVSQENDNGITLETANERVIIPRGEIDERQDSPLSMMPEGMLPKLTDDEVRDLIAYLAGPAQVPLPKAATTSTGGSSNE
jgi:putative heme-binding domain-containing protein